MAGTPERYASRTLTREAKDRIGNFYLATAIRDQVPEDTLDWTHSGFVNHCLYSEETGISIPPSLFDSLKLAAMKWRVVLRSPSNVLLIGRLSQIRSRISTDIVLADATIEIASRTERINFPSWPNEWKDKSFPFYVRIAGVADQEGQKRILAAAYDLDEGSRLTRLDVSVSSEEMFSTMWRNVPAFIHPGNLFITIPTPKDQPYQDAGFITKAMQEALGEKENLLQFSSALTFQIESDGTPILRRAQNQDEQTKMFELFESLGYHITRHDRSKEGFGEESLIVVGLKKEEAEKRDVAPWEISVPAALQKA